MSESGVMKIPSNVKSLLFPAVVVLLSPGEVEEISAPPSA